MARWLVRAPRTGLGCAMRRSGYASRRRSRTSSVKRGEPPGASGAGARARRRRWNECGPRSAPTTSRSSLRGPRRCNAVAPTWCCCAPISMHRTTPVSRALELTNIRKRAGAHRAVGHEARHADVLRRRVPGAPAVFDKSRSLCPDIWGVLNLKTKDDRHAPIFLCNDAGCTRVRDAGVATLFSKTMLRCLDGEAGYPRRRDRGLADHFGSLSSAHWRVASAPLAGAATDQECDTDHAMTTS